MTSYARLLAAAPGATRRQHVKGGVMTASKRLLLVVVGLLIGSLITSFAWGSSGGGRADPRASDRVTAKGEIVRKTGQVPIVTAFVRAMNSFEYENVRTLFTRDGVLTTMSNTHFSIYRNKLPLAGQRVDGAEFRRLIGAHQGMHDTMKTLGAPLEVGSNTVVFGFSFGSGITGTAMFHLRNGKIVIGILQASQYQIPFGGG